MTERLQVNDNLSTELMPDLSDPDVICGILASRSDGMEYIRQLEQLLETVTGGKTE